MKLLLPIFILMTTCLCAQDPICSKYVKFDRDSVFHDLGKMILPAKVSFGGEKGIEITIAGDQGTIFFDLKLYGTDAIFSGRTQILLALDDNTEFIVGTLVESPSKSCTIIFADDLIATGRIQPISSFLKFKDVKIRGIRVSTDKGYLSGPLTTLAKDALFHSIKCIMY